MPRRRDKRATRMEASEELDHAGTAPGATGAKETAAGGGDSPMNENVGAGAMGTSVAETEVAAPGSGGKSAGTPDLPQSEPRSLTADDDDDERSGAAGVTADARDDDAGAELRPSRSPDDASVAPTTTTTTTTPADPSSGDPSRSLADVLGKRPTPASDPKSSASAKPPAKKAARAKPLSGPGITSFFGGGGKGGSGSDEDAPSRMPTRAEKLAADEAEEAAAIAAALAASEADEEDRRVKAAAAEAAATAEAVQDHEDAPSRMPTRAGRRPEAELGA